MWLKIRKITCAAGVLLAMLLTGCAGGDTKVDVSGKADGKEGQKENKEGEGLTITNFHYLLSDAFMEAFHEKYPEINLEITNYSGMNGSGYAQYSWSMGISRIYISLPGISAGKLRRNICWICPIMILSMSIRKGCWGRRM